MMTTKKKLDQATAGRHSAGRHPADTPVMTVSTNSAMYRIDQPQALLDLADELHKFISERNLTTKIQDRDYVQVEGWQYLGSCLGIMPVVERVENLSTETEIKYETTVALKRLSNDQIIGRGISVCSNREAKRRNSDEYVIKSMSQTRAIGKAFRNNFAWVIKAAGYEATPAEEMDGVFPEPVAGNPVAGNPAPTGSPAAGSPAAVPLATGPQKDLLKRLMGSHHFEGDVHAEKVLTSIRDNTLKKATASRYIDQLTDNRDTGEIGVLTMRQQLEEAANLPEFPAEEQVDVLAALPSVWTREQYETIRQSIEATIENAIPF